MEIEDKIQRIVENAKYCGLHSREATRQILLLLDVVGRSKSFVCGHPPKRTYLFDGTWHCEECGGKWESIANK